MNVTFKSIKMIILLIFILSIGHAALAQTDECDANSGAVDKLVCADSILSQLNAELSAATSEEVATLSPQFLDAFNKEKIDWLDSREKACPLPKKADAYSKATECLKDLYGLRVNYTYSLIALRGSWKKNLVINGEKTVILIPKDDSDALGRRDNLIISARA